MVPVTLLSGFLGSGKTTLLNAALAHPGLARTAVVVNEFGEIGLDHLLIARSSDNIVLLESGCLCCTISESLHETLADLQFRRRRGEIPGFDRVVVETSGLADPGPILNTLLGHRLVTDHYRLDAVVATVDAQHALATLRAHREAERQIAVADRLALTKTDLAEPAPGLLARLDELNPGAERFDVRDRNATLAAFGPSDRHRLAAAAFRATPSADVRSGRWPGGGLHAPGIRADSVVLPGPTTWAGLASWWNRIVEVAGDRLLRCKGVVEIAESGEIVFIQGVQRVFHTPERLPGWPDADHRSRLVLITRDVDAAVVRATWSAFDREAGLPPDPVPEALASGGTCR